MADTNQRLNEEVRKKTKAASGYLAMYNKLKYNQLNVDVGVAANHDADNVLQSASAGIQRMPSQRAMGMPPRRSNSNGSGGSGEQHRRMSLAYANSNGQTYRGQNSRAGQGGLSRKLSR